MGQLVKGSPSTRLSGFQHHRQLKVMPGIRDSNTQEIEAGTSQTQGHPGPQDAIWEKCVYD